MGSVTRKVASALRDEGKEWFSGWEDLGRKS